MHSEKIRDREVNTDMALQIKRIYDAFQKSDGTRLLVDRLWPRGVSRDKAHLDGWVKELAPQPPASDMVWA